MSWRAFQSAAAETHALELHAQPTELRRCLGCDCWFHSTGSDHRRCNLCKGTYGSARRGSLVGEPIRMARRRKFGEVAE